MRNRLCLIFAVMFLLCLLPSIALAGPMVRVGIVNGKESVTISGQRAFSLVDANDGHVLVHVKQNEKVRVDLRDGQLYLNNQLQKASFFARLEPEEDDNEFLVVDGRRYRGELEIRPSVTKKGITVIEILPVEEYLYGLIPWEISPAWPMEAVKAQAVAARTYALYTAGKHAKDGFDLCNTTDCQVYGGRDAEDPRGNWGVDATRGIVVTYKNKLIPAFFHSSGGGYTENVENVWSGKYDFIRAVPDFDQNSPYFNWKTTLTIGDINKRLEAAGYKIGNLQGIKLSPLQSGINETVDRGISGRVKTMTFLGSEQSVTLTGNDARRLFQLNSTLFDVRLPESAKNDQATQLTKPILTLNITKPETGSTTPVSRKKVRKKQTQTSMADTESKPALVSGTVPPSQGAPIKPDTGSLQLVRPAAEGMHVVDGGLLTTQIIFEGHGSGHGLGLSQWGAKAMAEFGPKDDLTYYQQILKHYYQGVEITKWY